MAIDFPSTGLTVGQIFTSGGASWKWDGTKWVSNAASDGYLPLAGGTISGTPGTLVVNKNTAAPITVISPFVAQFQGPDTGACNVANVAIQGGANFLGFRGNGTASVPATLTAGQGTTRFQAGGYDGTAWITNGPGQITFVASETWGATAHGMTCNIATTPNGTTTPTTQAIFSQGLTLGQALANGADNGRGTLIANANAAAPLAAFTGGLNNVLVLQGADATSCVIDLAAFSGNPSVNCFRYGGTVAGGLTATTSGSIIGRFAGGGYGGATLSNSSQAACMFYASENWSETARGSSFNVNTTVLGSITTTIDALIVDGSGNLAIKGATATKPGGGSWVAPSDPALKSDVTPYTDGLDALLQLEPIRYQYSGKGGLPKDGTVYVGLDAREAAKVLPSLVGMMTHQPVERDEDGEVMSQGAAETYLTVDPSELIFTLINSVRELSERLAAMEAKLA